MSKVFRVATGEASTVTDGTGAQKQWVGHRLALLQSYRGVARKLAGHAHAADHGLGAGHFRRPWRQEDDGTHVPVRLPSGPAQHPGQAGADLAEVYPRARSCWCCTGGTQNPTCVSWEACYICLVEPAPQPPRRPLDGQTLAARLIALCLSRLAYHTRGTYSREGRACTCGPWRCGGASVDGLFA